MTRDYAYEALAEVTGSDMTEARGQLNAALKSIRSQAEIDDSYLLADEIHVRAKLYRTLMPDVMLTPPALAKHWLRVVEETAQRKVPATNQAATSDCPTCGGDRFVLVGTRPAQASIWMRERGLEPRGGLEEMAPCPDCGPDVKPLRRFDGTMNVPMDPATVRERMRTRLADAGPAGTPEWVHVWAWARRTRRDERPFPQQAERLDAEERERMMTLGEYNRLYGEWAGAGSPKAAP